MPVTEYIWDDVNDCVLEETDELGTTQVTYTHEPGSFGPLVSEYRGGTTYNHHYDALGSTTMLTDDSGTVTDTFQYDAWGTAVARTGATPTPYTWVGRWGYQDDTVATGGYYIRARSYQPTVARWVSVDPNSRFPVSLISYYYLLYVYGYSANRSGSFFDPSGLQCTDMRPNGPYPPVPAPSSTLYPCDTTGLSANAIFLNLFAFFNACSRPTGFLTRPGCLLPPSMTDDWVVLSGTIVDDIRNQPGMLREEQAVETNINGYGSSNASGLKCGETRCFTSHGATRLQAPIGDDPFATHLGLAFGAYYVYYVANCNVGPATATGGGNCTADLKCSVRWTFYDRFDFAGLLWLLTYQAGRPFKITASWSTVYHLNITGPDACCCR